METRTLRGNTEHELAVCADCGMTVVRLFGQVGGEELMELVEALVRDDAWLPGRRDLWDVRELTDLFVTPAEAERLRLRTEQDAHGAVGRTALLTRTTSQHAYGIVLLESLCAASHRWKCFRTEREATRWLRGAQRDEAASGCGSNCLLHGSRMRAEMVA